MERLKFLVFLFAFDTFLFRIFTKRIRERLCPSESTFQFLAQFD